MKNIAIIFPNQLFEIDYLPYELEEIDEFIIVEDSIYFNDQERVLKFNMLKLIYQRACMKYYESYLVDNSLQVNYINWNKSPDNLYKFIKREFGTNNTLYIIDPVDELLESRINIFSKKYGQKIVFFDTPSFLLTQNDLESYIDTTNNNQRFSQRNLYIWYRKKFNILMEKSKPIGGKYSFDKYNRKPLPGKNFNNFMKSNKIKNISKTYDNDFYAEAIDYCETIFENYYPDNYVPGNIYLYPVTHADSKKNFIDFMKYKLKYFGEYQDAIDFNETFMFHSVISSQQNIGLITPGWVIETILKNFKKNGDDLLFDTEAYIRQLIWREYSRLLYKYARGDMMKNYFGNNRKLNNRWYKGNTGVEPVDMAIKTAFQYGYLHHIIRLMVICNFMNLCNIDPDDVYKWFMEFSLDSYDWVMINNVYSMGLYADGGLTTSKPYISSSNYIIKMSNLKKDKNWNVTWDVLYYNFIRRNYNKLKGRGKIYQSHWNKQKRKPQIISNAELFINHVTS
nr:putative deoxyribodipyrimidine photolyase-related protein [Megavirus caiporensis]